MPECNGEIWYEHWHRYALARHLSRHCTVLDVACGEGYGAAMVAENADRVVGVDISVDAIHHAHRHYSHQANLEFITASCDCLPFPDASFDLAISFETIEHIEAQQAFIAELARVLRPGGVLILSSPNKRLYSDAHDYHNEFHVRELYRNELEDLLRETFPYRSWLGQKLMFHSAIWPESQTVTSTEYLVGDGGQVAVSHCPSAEPMYYIVTCSRNPSMLPAALNRLSLFSDTPETVYRDYVRQTRRVMELDRLLIDRERLVAERDALLVLRNEQIDERDRMIAERDALLALRNGQIDERDRMIAERDTLLVLRNEQIDGRDRMIAERDALLALRNGQIDERDRMIAERDALLALRNGQIDGRDRMIAERDALLALRTGQMEEHERMIAERDALLALRNGQIDERDRMIAERDALLALRTGQTEERERMIALLNHELDYRASLAWWFKSPWRIIKRAIKGKH